MNPAFSMMPLRPLLLALLTICAPLTPEASALDTRLILPGQRLGLVTIGATRQEIHETLGRPATSTRLADGTLREDWLSRRLAPQAYVRDGLYYKHDFITVYFRKDRAVQAEASFPTFHTTAGLTRASDGHRFRQHYPHFATIIPPHFSSPDPSGCPAPKHYVVYEDATTRGIAWRYGAWGGLAPDPGIEQLEMIIVHQRGNPVLIDPDGGMRLVWTVPPHELMEHYPRK